MVMAWGPGNVFFFVVEVLPLAVVLPSSFPTPVGSPQAPSISLTALILFHKPIVFHSSHEASSLSGGALHSEVPRISGRTTHQAGHSLDQVQNNKKTSVGTAKQTA